MGKSKNGGTRAFVRGRIGSDVYSIGKNGQGKKQQVIRSLAETVANPQTPAQMRGRMIMSTVMQAVSAMAAIIDHSFDNVPVGQPSISEFIAQNYNLVKADVLAHPSTGNQFGLNQYKEKGVKQGIWVIASGKAAALAGYVLNGSAKTVTIDLGSNVTMGGLKAALGITANDFFTVCAIDATKGFVFCRFHLASDIADATAITSSNVASVFTTDGNVAVTPSLSSSSIVLTFATLSANAGIIVSRATSNGWQHNDVQLAAPTAPAYTADVALPTYPIGEQRFLNGGDESFSLASAGGSVVNPGGGSDQPSTPTVAAPTISGTTPFTESTNASITGPDGATIYYTTDGTDPTTSSTVYSSAIALSATTTVKAIAVKDGVSSSVASKLFTKSEGGDDDPMDQN